MSKSISSDIFNFSLIIVSIILISSCGGGGDAGTTPVSNKITSAESFNEYLSELQSYHDSGLDMISVSEIANYLSYNNQLSEYQNDSSAKSISNPFDGVYQNFVQPGETNSSGQPYVNIWPSYPNGEFTLTPVNSSFSSITNARDLTNNQTLDGDFKIFFGVKETESFGTSDQRIPVLILMEGIVKLNGQPQYRVLNTYEGYLYESDILNGPSYSGVPGSLFSGTYTQYVIEAFNGGMTGYLSSYEAYFIRDNNSPSGLPHMWRVPELIDASDNPISALRLKFDGSGNAFLTWIEEDDSFNRSLWVMRYTANMGWGSRRRLVGITGNSLDIDNYDIAINNNGKAIIVWSERYTSSVYSHRVFSTNYTPGLGWSSSERIEASTTNATVPVVAIDQNGNAIAVFFMDDGMSANRYVAGSGWGTAQSIDPTTNNIMQKAGIDMDDDGNAIVVWWHYSTQYGINLIRSNSYTVSSGWGDAQSITGVPNFKHGRPDIQFDNNGNALAVWPLTYGNNYHILSRRFTFSDGWEDSIQTIETTLAGPLYLPKITFDANGNALLTWKAPDPDVTYNHYLWSSYFTANGGWGTPQLLIDGAYTPDLTMSSNGNAFLVWEDPVGYYDSHILGKQFVMGNGWSDIQIVDSSSGFRYNGFPGAAPDIAYDITGDPVAVWAEQDRNTYRYNIMINRFE